VHQKQIGLLLCNPQEEEEEEEEEEESETRISHRDKTQFYSCLLGCDTVSTGKVTDVSDRHLASIFRI
jgi:hypothetical protein